MEYSAPRKQFPWATAIIAATLVIIAAFALLLLAYVRTLGEAKGIASAVARNFKTGTITQTFRESIPKIASTQGDVLELAVSQSDETFKRSDEKWIGWDYIYLGTTVVEIRVPVTFRYHLRLSDTWRLAARDHVCVVLAPPIRPSLPPAIHTELMEKRAESGWARFDKNDKLDDLERSLTTLLKQRAMDAAHLRLAREACRQSVAEFVKRWLLREEHWRTDRFSAIVVVFPDEVSVVSDRGLLQLPNEPAIKLD
jgi:hypothetical protein